MIRIRTFLAIGLVLKLFYGCVPVVIDQVPPGESVWRGTVRIKGDVEIPAGSSVHILPGTEVVFLPPGESDRLQAHPHFVGSELIVRGRIVAEGTAEKPVVFRFEDPEAPRGSWGGINVMASPYASFDYCLFTQADSAIHSQESEVTIEQSIFRGNHVGIRFHSSEILIENNLIRDNGTGIRFHFGAPVICNNRIEDNDKGLFITSEPQDYLIRNNELLDNQPYSVVLGASIHDDVELMGNWWGELSSKQIEASLFDFNRDTDLGKVLYDPRLHAPPSGTGPSWSR